MINKIATSFESGLYAGMILINLQKAFDTVNHITLLKKMKFMGFSEKTTKWFKSYLPNRKTKFILRIPSQDLKTSYVEFLKNLF